MLYNLESHFIKVSDYDPDLINQIISCNHKIKKTWKRLKEPRIRDYI